jgi:hypothetical protein
MTQHSFTRAHSLSNGNSMQNTHSGNFFKKRDGVKNRYGVSNSAFGGNPEDFIPFIRERDSIGRLIQKSHDLTDAGIISICPGNDWPTAVHRFSPTKDLGMMTSRTNDFVVSQRNGIFQCL